MTILLYTVVRCFTQSVHLIDDNDDDYDTSGVVCDTEESELSILRRLAALTTLASS